MSSNYLTGKSCEELLDETQRVAKIGSWQLDLKTKKMEWSKQMYQLFKTDPALGSPSYDEHVSTIHPDDRDNWSSHVTRCSKEGIAYKMRFRTLADGVSTWIEAHGEARRDSNGTITSIGGTYQDISSLVANEEKVHLANMKTLQTAKVASLLEMSSGVSHEINNALAIIAGSVNLLPSAKDNPEAFQKRLQSMERATERIGKAVTNLRKFAKSNDKPEYKTQQLGAIVKEAVAIKASLARDTGVTVELSVDSPLEISCNEVEIQQLVVHLLKNSLYAVQDLEERWVKLELREDGDQVVLSIKDSGRGIPSPIQTHLYQPFFTTKPNGQGSGLGLAIVKGILDQHHASIELVVEDVHTRFDIRFNKAQSVIEVA